MIRHVASLARRLTPPAARAWLRRSRLVNAALRGSVGGSRSRPHPRVPFTLHFDGYRNVGWNFGGLESAEAASFDFAERVIRALQPDCAWDIGANVGLWTLFLAGAQPRIGAVVAYEPDPTNLSWLRKNLDANGLNHVTVRPVALSDHAGKDTFHADALSGATGSLEAGERFTERHYGAATRPIEVELSTADAELASGTPPPQLVKMDVEGHELSALKGARQLLADHRPVILLEVTEHIEEVGALLGGHDYALTDPETLQTLAAPRFMTAAVPRERLGALGLPGGPGGASA